MSHEDKVFFGNFVGVLAVLVVIAFIFFFLADLATDGIDEDAGVSMPVSRPKLRKTSGPLAR